MDNKEYNGWTNYATWRVNLEIFDSMELGDIQTGSDIKQLAEDLIFDSADDSTSLMGGYAEAFLEDVNWEEIAEAMNDKHFD